MLQIRGHQIAQGSSQLAMLGYFGKQVLAIFDDPSKQSTCRSLEGHKKLCDRLGLSMTSGRLARLIARVGDIKGDQLPDDFREMALQADEVYRDELKKYQFLFVSPDRAILYRAQQPFGPDVYEAFPLAQSDCEQASTCIALELPTACAFHCMRVVEVGVRAFRKASKIPIPPKDLHKQTWGMLLRPIRDELDILTGKKPGTPSAVAKIKHKLEFFSETHANLNAVKIAWRDPTMHLERPFDDTEARRVYAASYNLMEHLAAHIDGNGRARKKKKDGQP